MLSSIHKLTLAAVGSATLLVAAGCQMPSFARSENSELESAPSRVAAQKPEPKPVERAVDEPADKVSAAIDEATQARMIQQVRQISAEDPAAGQLLLDELSGTEPKLWPLTLQQFRARQAYHDQLRNKPKKAVEPKASDPLDVVSNEVASTDPPSEEVGQLKDPRGIRPDPNVEQAFAQATPANMPAPIDPAPPETNVLAQATPAAFTADAAATPLADQQPPIARQQVVQASAVNANQGAVEQALFSAGAGAAPVEPKHDWQQHLKLAIDDLNVRLADGPRSTAEVHQLVSLRMLELLVGDTEAALKPIPNVSTEEQDYWSGQLFALATFLDHHRQPEDDRRAAASVVHLDEAVGHLRELGTLSLRNLAFCKNVFGYGAYEPINNPSFTPGQQVTLYLEIENYHSESTPKGYATKLGASYELVNDAGERVAGGEFPNIEDCCQSRRRDFHIQYGLVLPKTAKPGKHHLKLAMNDRQSDKMGNASITFEIR